MNLLLASPILAQSAPADTPLGTVYQSILDGGWMMVPISLCSIIALAFFVERLAALKAGRLLPRNFAEELGKELAKGATAASAYCQSQKAPIALIMDAGLRRWHSPRTEIEKAVEDAGAREIGRLSGNLRPLVVVAAVSPLLGLLGTVLGMIKSFGVIAAESGIGKPELLAGGISQALVTTAAGLIVAIPAQVGYYFLKAKIDRFAREAETLYHDVIGAALEAQNEAA